MRYTPKEESHIFQKLLVVCVLVAIAGWLIVSAIIRINTFVHNKLYKEKAVLKLFKDIPEDSLQKRISKQMSDATGSYGIAVRKIAGEDSYYFNEHKQFLSASLYKVWVMTLVYQNVEKGIIRLDDELSRDVQYLNKAFDIASEEAELTSGTVFYTVREALEKMITYSDNYSALLLTDLVKPDSIRIFLKNYGLSESRGGEDDALPSTTASDMNKFFEKLYKSDYTSKRYTDEMIKLLERQHLNTVLPKYLPQNVKVAHKTGALQSVDHDAGIVFGPGGPYLIAVLSDTGVPLDAEERMAKVSKEVYDYFVIQAQIEKENEQAVQKFFFAVEAVSAGIGLLIVYFFIKRRFKRPSGSFQN